MRRAFDITLAESTCVPEGSDGPEVAQEVAAPTPQDQENQ
jgi:hypothetical protein